MEYTRILILASGGGHTGYAISIAERLVELDPSIEPLFIVPRGDKWSIDRINRKLGETKFIEVAKLRNPGESLVKIIYRLPRTFIDSLRIHGFFDVMICTGSNHGITPVITAWFRRVVKSIYCIEDVFRLEKPSRAVNILHKLGLANVFLQWREQYRLYDKRSIYAGLVYEKPMYRSVDKGYVLVTMGTLGHPSLAELLLKTNLEYVIVQTGRLVDPQYIRSRKPGWRVFQFDPDIDKLIAEASVIVSSPGLTAINAAIAYRKPTIMVYNPNIVLGASFKEIARVAEMLNIPFINPLNIEPGFFEEIVLKAKPTSVEVVDGGYNISKYIVEFLND
ncbi:MAG: glycosyltransferase [Desulfurococcaceae archaeon]